MSTAISGEESRLSERPSGVELGTIHNIAHQNAIVRVPEALIYPPFGIPTISRYNIVGIGQKIVVPVDSSAITSRKSISEFYFSRSEVMVIILLRNIFILCTSHISREYRFYHMIRTKEKDYHQILVDGENYNTLHLRYGASRSFNDVITEILRHHESAISIIADCESCKAKFKEAIAR